MNRSKLWILVFLVVTAGCHKRNRGVTVAPPPPAPVAASAALPPSLMDAESAFDTRDFLRAATSYEIYFQSAPQSTEGDRLRFRFGVSQSLSGIPTLEKASADTFKQLIRDYPTSSYVPPARMAIALQDDIVRLHADKLSQDDRIRQLTALVPPAPPVLPAALAEAEAAFDIADFANAAKSYEVYLQSNPQTKDMERILLRYGVAQSMSGVPAREAASNDTFKQLIRDFPKSPTAISAGRVLALRADILRLQSDIRAKDDKIQKLNEELDKLKKIDSERRRTP